jgi:hypothetical protein
VNVLDLMNGVPGLLDELRETGLPDDKLPDLGSAIGRQLGGDDGLDFTDLLGGLDLDGFLAKVDVASLAEQVGITPALAQQVIATIGPKVAEFTPGGLGGLGALAGKLFD